MTRGDAPRPPCIACTAENDMVPKSAAPGELVATGIAFAKALPFVVLCKAHAEIADAVAEGAGQSVRLAMHAALDKALAVYLDAHPGKRPSTSSMLEVLEWSASKLTEAERTMLAKRGT